MINIQLLIASLPLLLQGLSVSLRIALFSATIGLVGGFIWALLQLSPIRMVSFLVTIFTGIIRGTPMLIQIFFVYYALPYWGINIDAFWTAVISIGINSSAYISQVIRSGIQAIARGQYEAAQVIGLSKFDTFRFIVFPQTVAFVIPSLTNELVTLVKDSALASLIGVFELSKAGKIIISQTYDSITIFFAVGCLYLLLTVAIGYGMSFVERKVRKHVEHNSSC